MLIWCFVISFSDFLYKSVCCRYPFELHRQVDAIQMGTHNTRLYKGKNYTDCNLKTTELFECALVGVCAVIRLNIIHKIWSDQDYTIYHSSNSYFYRSTGSKLDLFTF